MSSWLQGVHALLKEQHGGGPASPQMLEAWRAAQRMDKLGRVAEETGNTGLYLALRRAFDAWLIDGRWRNLPPDPLEGLPESVLGDDGTREYRNQAEREEAARYRAAARTQRIERAKSFIEEGVCDLGALRSLVCSREEGQVVINYITDRWNERHDIRVPREHPPNSQSSPESGQGGARLYPDQD